MITVTLNKIKQHHPCVSGWCRVLEANGGYRADLSKDLPVSSILDSNGLDDTLWVCKHLTEYDTLWCKFAWWCANQVIENTEDKRIKKCLDTVWLYSEGLATEKRLSSALRSAEAAAWIAPNAAASSASVAVVAAADGSLQLAASSAEASFSEVAFSESWELSQDLAKGVAWSRAISSKNSAGHFVRSLQEAKLRSILDTGKFEK